MIFSRKNKVVHREVIELKASPAQLREFIMTPARILDYYPAGIDGEIIAAGASFYCRGKSGVSLLERVAAESTPSVVVVKVTTANIKPPYSAERIRAAALFTMLEDWQLTPHGTGTTLTKTWRNITMQKMKWLPMRWIVRRSAKAESAVLKAAWNKAALQN